MDPYLDDFISYEYQENPTQEGLFDTNFFLTSPFSDNSNHPSILTNFLPESPYNLLSPHNIPQSTGHEHGNETPPQQSQTPSTVTNKRQGASRSPKEPLDLSKLYIPPALQGELGTKLNCQSKKISKQAKSTEDSENQETADQKKMNQMLKNRMSAQNSRDKKKVYMQQLEAENVFLKQEKVLMLDRMQKLETGYMQVLKENEMLKSSGSNICYKCGCTGEFENNVDSQLPVPSSESINSVSAPLIQRSSSRSGALGFSYTFTTVLLLIFAMAEDKGPKSIDSSPSPVINTHTRILEDYETSTDFPIAKDLTPEPSIPSTAEPSVILEESFESQYGGLSRNGVSILNQIESMVDDFDANHEKIYGAYEGNNNSIFNLSQPMRNVTALSSETSNLGSNSSGKSFLSKPIVKSRNKTSTLFCPSGFEFFKGGSEEDYADNYTDFSFLSDVMGGYGRKQKPLSLEKAEYVQLLIPRNSISRLSVSGNSSEVDRSVGYNNSQGDAVVQVWCKIFAVKGLTRSM